jgi:hypothetical protein
MNSPALPPTQVIESAATLWGAALQPAGCPQCRQAHLVEAARLGQPCPNCARGHLAPQPASLRPEPPELLVPFHKSRQDVRLVLTNFTKEVWLRPDDCDAEQMLQRAMPVYWPMWLVDCEVTGDWQAETGFDYQVKSSQESYTGSGWSSQDIVETRIRWEPRAGQIDRHYDNIAVPAVSEHQHLTRHVGAYQLAQAAAYAPAQVAGAALRVPDLPPESAWPLAQANLDQAAGEECRQAAAAQHLRNFSLRAAYESLHWTQLLLPLYATYYTDDNGQRHPIYINGQTGTIGGVRLASQRKGWMWAGITLGVAAAVFVVALLVSALGMVFPPAIIIGVILGIAALGLACGAIVPAAWPWQWNRRQPDVSAK